MVRYIEEENGNEELPTLQESLPLAYLTLIVDGRMSHSFPLRGEVQLGRDKTNAVVAADQKVSRHHATLTPVDNTYIITDQGSVNGTYVNGVLIAQPTRLNNNDRVRFGDTTFLFTTRQPKADAVYQPLPPPVSPARNLAPNLAERNTPIWVVIGCMALIMVVLLVLVAILLGIFVGRGQVTGLAVGWLIGMI